MKKILRTFFITLMVISTLVGCSGKEPTSIQVQKEEVIGEEATKEEQEKEVEKQSTTDIAEPIELTILAAASLKDVTGELAKMYKEIEPNVELTFSYGASGALQTQIEEGAPADIFLSAATKQMDALDEGGFLLDGTKKDLLINKVVLIMPKESTLSLKEFQDVGTDSVKSIALGEPESVPCGQYAKEVFTNLNIWDTVKEKANYGSDVKQVLTWVESSEVDCGVVYATDAIISDKVSIVCKAPEGSHNAITYPVAVTKSSTNPNEAKAFLDFLFTKEASKVFEQYGFTMK